MAAVGATMSHGRYLPRLKWNLSMNTPATSADTVSTADAPAAMKPEMASGSCATSVRKNRKNAVSSVAAMEKPISEAPQTVLILELIPFMKPPSLVRTGVRSFPTCRRPSSSFSVFACTDKFCRRRPPSQRKCTEQNARGHCTKSLMSSACALCNLQSLCKMHNNAMDGASFLPKEQSSYGAYNVQSLRHRGEASWVLR